MINELARHVHEFTGGPEAMMIQLGLAFLPYGKVFWEGNRTQGGVHPTIFHEKYKMEYGDAPGAIDFVDKRKRPTGRRCVDLTGSEAMPSRTCQERGPRLQLADLALRWKPDLASKMFKSKNNGFCKVVTHNFYIGALEKLPRQNIVRPFISPSMAW
jgi:hypothetical protein